MHDYLFFGFIIFVLYQITNKLVKMISEIIKLNSGNTIPSVGLGVYLTPPNVTENITIEALKAGYRHIDSAQYYENEHEVCEGISKWIKEDPSKNKREDVFFTTKIFDVNHGYELTKKAINASLEKAKDIGYIDLILMHSPQSNYEKRHGSWIALQEAVKSGLVKNIGVSNYGVKHLKELLSYSDLTIKPAVNQVEIHPWLARKDITEYCKENDIKIEAYSPLVKGLKMNDEHLVSLSKKYNKTPAQILLNWSLSKGYIVLPKTVTPSRLVPNLEATSFQLSDEDIATLDNIDESLITCWDPTVYPLDDEKK